MNRSLSNKYSNNKKEKKYNLIKDIFKTHPVNYNYSNLKLLKGNQSWKYTKYKYKQIILYK